MLAKGALVPNKNLFLLSTQTEPEPADRLNIKMSSCQYRDSHYKDNTASQPFYPLIETPYLKRTFLCWNRPLISEQIITRHSADYKAKYDFVQVFFGNHFSLPQTDGVIQTKERHVEKSWGLCSINPSRPSDAYMRQLNMQLLVQKIACRLSGTKSLSEPMLPFCKSDPSEQISLISWW